MGRGQDEDRDERHGVVSLEAWSSGDGADTHSYYAALYVDA